MEDSGDFPMGGMGMGGPPPGIMWFDRKDTNKINIFLINEKIKMVFF